MLRKAESAHQMGAILQVPELVGINVIEVLLAGLTFDQTGEEIGRHLWLLLVGVGLNETHFLNIWNRDLLSVFDWVEFRFEVL